MGILHTNICICIFPNKIYFSRGSPERRGHPSVPGNGAAQADRRWAGYGYHESCPPPYPSRVGVGAPWTLPIAVRYLATHPTQPQCNPSSPCPPPIPHPTPTSPHPTPPTMQEILSRDAGKLKMPTLPEFYRGLQLPIIISRDATGKGSLQFTTAAACVPWASKSCKTLHIFGFGNCGDDRNGSRRLFGPNLETINTWVDAAAEDKCSTIDVDGETRSIFIDPHFTDDVSALRHGEHLANSGWCGCDRDKALRQLPLKPDTILEMKTLVAGEGERARCRELSCKERENLSHNPHQGDELPSPCLATGCSFAHDPATRATEYRELLAKEADKKEYSISI